jgi:hypothetical protein
VKDRRALIKAAVKNLLGDSAEASAFAGALDGISRQIDTIRDQDKNAPDEDQQRKRMEELHKLLTRLQHLTGTFSEKDWLNYKVMLYQANPPKAGWELFEIQMQNNIATYADAAGKAASSRSKRIGGPKDTNFWIFIYRAIADYRLFFEELPPHAERSKFVQLLEQVGPLVIEEWGERNYAAAIRSMKMGEFSSRK